jgi:hypothetical protein
LSPFEFQPDTQVSRVLEHPGFGGTAMTKPAIHLSVNAIVFCHVTANRMTMLQISFIDGKTRTEAENHGSYFHVLTRTMAVVGLHKTDLAIGVCITNWLGFHIADPGEDGFFEGRLKTRTAFALLPEVADHCQNYSFFLPFAIW